MSSSPPPPVVYGELSILGYNGYIPNCERNGRRNKSKFLLCRRPIPNGIKKSEHYIVKQPQDTKAIQDKDNYSISYTFSRSQTIIVEYKQDATTDLFQIGRSSEDPIDFVVMDTASVAGYHGESIKSHQTNHKSHHPSSKSSSVRTYDQFRNQHNVHAFDNQQIQQPIDLVEMTRFHRHLAKVEEEMLHRGIPPYLDNRGRMQPAMYGHLSGQPQPIPLNYPQPNLSNLPPLMAEHFRRQDPSLFQLPPYTNPSGSQQQNQYHYQHFLPQVQPNLMAAGDESSSHDNRPSINDRYHNSNRNSTSHGNQKRSHAAQSTISRFACRIIVDRDPPYLARIYAAGFDSSKNIFLGEKATKWEHNNSIDGLTTNGILLMHPKRGYFCENALTEHPNEADINRTNKGQVSTGQARINEHKMSVDAANISAQSDTIDQTGQSDTRQMDSIRDQSHSSVNDNDRNNNPASKVCSSNENFEYGGVWREVSVDGGIYAIRESRSAVQKGKRIENETNILQDGTLIDLCGATLLWRSVDGFKSSPTKRTLEEKIDLLNASRPQCPVGLNTLVIPRKPIIPSNPADRYSCRRNNSNHYGHTKDHSHPKDHHHHSLGINHGKSSEKGGSSQQPYVYLKCGHVQGYHDWGATDKSDQRTCPICLSVGSVAKLSMGLEPSFYVDSGPLTHVFNPCGHMASERTIKYWTSIKIPHGTHFFHSICPFCATPLASDESTSTRLIFQDDLD